MNHLDGNPYEELARVHADQAYATLALAHEIAELRRIIDPYDNRRNNDE